MSYMVNKNNPDIYISAIWSIKSAIYCQQKVGNYAQTSGAMIRTWEERIKRIVFTVMAALL